jgi:addiction module RelE/StbE family toxin
MAEIIWSDTALADLDAIADYIAIENPLAAAAFVQRVLDHVEQLRRHPKIGPKVPELRRSRYRQLSEPPCRIFYRVDGRQVIVVHVMRAERQFQVRRFTGRR